MTFRENTVWRLSRVNLKDLIYEEKKRYTDIYFPFQGSLVRCLDRILSIILLTEYDKKKFKFDNGLIQELSQILATKISRYFENVCIAFYVQMADDDLQWIVDLDFAHPQPANAIFILSFMESKKTLTKYNYLPKSTREYLFENRKKFKLDRTRLSIFIDTTKEAGMEFKMCSVPIESPEELLKHYYQVEKEGGDISDLRFFNPDEIQVLPKQALMLVDRKYYEHHRNKTGHFFLFSKPLKFGWDYWAEEAAAEERTVAGGASGVGGGDAISRTKLPPPPMAIYSIEWGDRPSRRHTPSPVSEPGSSA